MIKNILKPISLIISLVSLAIILLLALLCFLGYRSFNAYLIGTNIATVVWFCFSPWWLISKKENSTR
ncbi:MAG: hypothetical protein ONB05_05830 [candidate division KSB1 bacterium]|nr:hypothetical protein [candidate division KSB1 bacterium]